MKLRPRQRKESPVRKVNVRMPLKKPKEKPEVRLNRRSVKSDGLVERNVEGERNQEEGPGPSHSGTNRPGCSRREVSTVPISSVSDIEIGPGSPITLLPEEVLDHIFGFLTLTDVKSARLVNKYWRQVTTTLLRRSSTLIKLDRSVSECITKMGDGQFPVNRLEVSLFYALEHTKKCSGNLSGICAWVKELTFSVHINMLSGVNVLDNLATFPTGTECVYKDLTHFNLQVIQQTDLFRESWKRITDFVRSILENSPNLREVNVAYKCESSRAGRKEKLAICPVIENIFPISNCVGTSKLSSINFKDVHLEKIDLAKWATLNLKPKKLELSVSCFGKTNNLLSKFLETQTGTLKHLILKLNRWDSKAMAFTFPRLEQLEQLRVICCSSYGALVTIADIDYARLFPCLKILDLGDNLTSWRDFLGNDLIEPTNTVEELIFPCHLDDDDMDLNPNPVVTAAKVFTGLKKLEISVDRVFIDTVYENMPNLEVLTLSNFSFGTHDDIITGLGLEMCRKFKGVMTATWIRKLQNAQGRSMARFQNLKTLKLTHCVLNDRLCISWLSLHVFKKMSSLKYLDIFNGNAKTAERCSANEDQNELLEELRANFVVL